MRSHEACTRRALILCAVAALSVLSLRARGDDAGAGGAALYDPGGVMTVSGEVVRVEKVPRVGGGRGVYLVLRTGTGEQIPIALGPEWVVERHALRILVGDHVDVMGWCIVRGKSALVASEVRKADARLLLRDRYGVPLWSRTGGGRRAR
jgi:hypothetical protein